jgi:hypothetical protein
MTREEQSRNEKEIGHAEGLGEGDDGPHEARRSGRLLDAERRMHHHHHDDAEALAVVDPSHAVLVKFHDVPPSSSRRGTIQGGVASPKPEPAGRIPEAIDFRLPAADLWLSGRGPKRCLIVKL